MIEEKIYRLRNGTHNIEREAAPLMESSLPEYEQFLNKYLLSLIGVDGSWRNDCVDHLEHIGIAHFGALKSINYIERNRSKIERGDPDQRFKNIYFHFGLVTECVDSMSRSIALCMESLKIISLPDLSKTTEELLSDFKTWAEKDYEKSLPHLLNGQPISYQVAKIDYLKHAMADSTVRRNYKNLKASIRVYRNFYTHNPGVDIIFHNGTLNVIRRDNLKLAKSWSTLKTLIKSDPSKFRDPKEQVNSDLTELLRCLRCVWTEFDSSMAKLVSNVGYSKLATNFVRT